MKEKPKFRFSFVKKYEPFHIMKKSEKNNFDNVFSYTFDQKFFLVGSKYYIDKINLKEL